MIAGDRIGGIAGNTGGTMHDTIGGLTNDFGKDRLNRAAATAGRVPAGNARHRCSPKLALLVAASLLLAPFLTAPAKAENQMGYRLLSPQEASSLPHNRGSLGMDIERAQEITDGGMTFDLIRVKQVRRGLPAAQAGFAPGDQIIAVDERVFPSLATFAAYVGSVQPGTPVNVDYIPANGGPAQAQRVAVTVGTAGSPAPPAQQAPEPAGMSTGTKIAIGVGAAALLGCYEMGCFSRRGPATGNNRPQLQQPTGSTAAPMTAGTARP